MNRTASVGRFALACLVGLLAIICLSPPAAVAQVRVRFPAAEASAQSPGPAAASTGGLSFVPPQPIVPISPTGQPLTSPSTFPIARTVYAGDPTGGSPFVTQYGAPDNSSAGARLQPSLLDAPTIPQTLGYQAAPAGVAPAYTIPAYGGPDAAGYGLAPPYGAGGYGGFVSPPNYNPASNQRIYAAVEALWLKINSPTDQPIVLDQNTLGNVLNVADLPFEQDPGVRAALAYSITCDYTIEGVYFGLHSWDNTAQTRGGANNLRLPGALGLASDDFFGADFMRADYTTRLHNAELNLWRRFGNTHWWGLAGFRYVRLAETFNIHSIDSDADQSDYHIAAKNDLYGGQIGAQYGWTVGNLELQLLGKGGVFANAAKESQTVFDNNNAFTLRTAADSKVNVAFAGEAGLSGMVKLTPSWFVRGGYTVLWLVDVARAPDQLDFTNVAGSGATISNKQTAFLHGPSIGLQGQW